MYWYDGAEHAEHAGQALAVLAMRDQFVGEASSRLASAIGGFGDTYVRSRMLCQIRLAAMTMAVGDPREAAAIGTEAMTAAGAIRSRRVAGDLRELSRIAGTHAGVPEVAELRHRIDRVVAGV